MNYKPRLSALEACVLYAYDTIVRAALARTRKMIPLLHFINMKFNINLRVAWMASENLFALVAHERVGYVPYLLPM